MQPSKSIALRAVLTVLLAWPALAQAIKVGTVNVVRQGAGTLVKVATEGKAEPTVSVLEGNKALIVVPGGVRSAMSPLKVSSGILKGIRFGAEGGDLRIVTDLKQAGSIRLGAIGEQGFEVQLSAAPVAKDATKASAPVGEAKAEEPTESELASLNPASAGYTFRVVDLALGGDDEQGELVISSDGPASYKSSLKEDGKVLSLTFRNSSLAWSGDGAKLSDASVSGVNVRQASEGGESLVKVDVRLREKLAYNLKRDQNQLVVRFNRPEAVVEMSKKGNENALVGIDVEDADVVSVMKALCQQAGFDYQFTKDILGKGSPENLVTLSVHDRPFQEVANTILSQVAAKYLQQGNMLFIGSDSEVEERKKRIPSVQRFYEPKYMSVAQLMLLVKQHFSRDNTFLGTYVVDPTNSSRIMLVGTATDVAEVFAAFAIYDVPESGEEAASSEGSGGGNAIRTQVYRLQYLDPSSQLGLVTGAIAQLYTGTGDEVPVPSVDPSSRTMVLTTRLKYLRKIEKLMARIDVKPDQVNIEGKIVEMNQGMSKALGIDWSAVQQQASPNSNLQFNTGLAADFASQLTYSTVQNGFNIRSRIQAAVNENKADLVSAPNITTNDNQPATISTSDAQISVATTSVVGANGTTFSQSFNSTSIPLQLVVTPKISRADRRILMDISFTLTSISGSPPIAGAPAPTSTQSALTKVSVSTGETAVIGGLVRQNNTEVERKTPILGDIPLLGLLFKYKTEQKTKREVIIFITPTIVED